MAWTKDQPVSLTFRNDAAAEVLTVAQVNPSDPNTEWSATLTKAGAAKGSVTLESYAALKGMFSDVGALL